MKPVKIIGVAKLESYRSDMYSSLEINGIKVEKLLVDQLLDKETVYGEKTALCCVSITIEPHTESLSVNGVEMKLEL